MLQRARRGWEEQSVCPNWIGKEVFYEILVYWDTPDFKARYENAKKMRASEKGGHLSAVGSISIAEHDRRMVIITTFLSYILIYYIFLIKVNFIN